MKITFVYPDLYMGWEGKWTGQFYLGLASLSAVLKRAGYSTSLIHVYDYPEQEEFLRRVDREEPDIVAFSTTSHMFSLVKKMSSWIKESGRKTPVICGGVHPTLDPEKTISHPGIDMICVGEGEYALLELCNALSDGKDYRNIASIWVKEDGKIFRNPTRPLIKNLDELPFPDTELFDFVNLTMEKKGFGNFSVSRGCPYNCTYCCNHAIKSVYSDSSGYTRRRSVDNVIHEIELVIARYPIINKIIFEDDILFVNKNWAAEFADKYSSKIGLPFECHARVNYIDEEMARLLKKAGCFKVKVGLESGNEYIREKVLNRSINQETIRNAVLRIKKQGVEILTYNILGLPFETPAQIMETIKLNAEMDVDYIMHTVFYPYPKTVLYDICAGKGFLTEKVNYSYFGDSVLNLDSITPKQIRLYHRYYDHIFRLYKILYRHRAFTFLIKPFDLFIVSSLWPLFCTLILNPAHSFYRGTLKPVLKPTTKFMW